MSALAITAGDRREYETSRRATLLALEDIDPQTILELTHLTLPEIEALRWEISQVLPAGNLPAFILGGLLKLRGRQVNASQVKRDLTTLFKGANLLPQGLYGAFIAGPSAVLYAYQKLLQLAGKDAASAFPEGTWQFYLQFGLREDTARHTNETRRFPRAFIQADEISAAAAWVWAIADFILDYDALLAADWTERVALRLLKEVAQETGRDKKPPFTRMSRDWNTQRPYKRPENAASGKTYLAHRHAAFQTFLSQHLAGLPAQARRVFQKRYQDRLTTELHAYQEQMSLLYALTPERYQEQRTPIPIWRARIGFVWQGHTYLIPLCQRDIRGRPLCYPSHPKHPSTRKKSQASPIPLRLTADDTLCGPDNQPVTLSRGGWVWSQDGQSLLGRLRPLSPACIKGGIAAILNAGPQNKPTLDMLLAASQRIKQQELRAALPEKTQKEIARLRLAPVILNWDEHHTDKPLPYIRRTHRGIGDHALTIVRTQHSFVFDQSHIFFDGLWGMAVSELLTNKAVYRHPQMTRVTLRAPRGRIQPLQLKAVPQVVQEAAQAKLPGEACAESDGVNMQKLIRLRRWLSQRGVRLTVNDLLLLYRYLHAGAYRPSRAARQAIQSLRDRPDNPQAQAAVKAIDQCMAQIKTTNPALLIPMDASNVAPRERIYPTTFRNPLQIDAQIAATHQAFHTFQSTPNKATWETFDKARREMLAYLQAFGELLNALKAVTMRGESFNTATLRMLAHLPSSMQHVLDQIPQRISVLNEIIKGTEVFSNVGRVARDSSLSRFSSARDDGATKQLIWGFLTDDQGTMHITLRDFRPFVPFLLQLKDPPGRVLADLLARDYLQAYVRDFNDFIDRLSAFVTLKKPD